MHLIERLEKRARELDSEVRRLRYNQQAADDRELLLEAADMLRGMVHSTCDHRNMVALDDKCFECPDCGYTT